MSGFLRQSTASQSRALGPFIDDTDFKTAKTGLTIANTDIKLVINGAASANKNSGGGTHRVNGVYGVTFDATDTATVGEIEVSVVVAGALAVFDKFVVVEEAVYDALFVAAAPGYVVDQPVNATKLAGQVITAAAGVTFPTSVASPTNITAGTIATVTNLTNAPTAGDLTATMKTSIGTAVAASAVASVTGNVGGNVVGSVGSLTANNDKTGYTLSNTGIDNVLDRAAGIETGVTPRQGFRLMLAALVGKLSGAATATVVMRDTGDAKDRITATVDANGNRSAVTLDAS